MELKEGMYVRTKKDGIGKITKIEEFIPFDDHIYLDSGKGDITFQNKNIVCKVNCRGNIVKASYNIIDLIEVGDYVNGLPASIISGTRYDKNDLRVWLAVATKYKEEYGVENSDGDYEHQTLYRCIKPENIKSIVTKEQFEQMKYEVK